MPYNLIPHSYLKSFEEKLKAKLQFFKKTNLKINLSVIKNVNSYINQELEKFILPSLALEINIARLKNELNGKTAKDRYKNFFVKNYPVDEFIFSKYPKLKNLFEIFTNSTIKSFYDCFENIDADWKEIRKTFPDFKKAKSLCGVEIPINGDRHHQGKQTLILKFNNGFKLVYKPNPTNIDGLLNFINKNLGKSSIQNIKLLNKNHYHYRLFLKKDNIVTTSKKVKEFYLQAGKILCLSYILNATDLHMDNIIVNKGKIYILDNETFFHHFSFKNIPKTNDIFLTNLLSNIKNKQKMGEISGLQGGSKARLSLLTPFIENKESDKIKVRYKTFSKFIPHNRIYLKNKLIEPKDHIKEIIDGFEKIYDFLKENKKIMIDLIEKYINKSNSNLKARQIIRSTSIYEFFIQSLFQPKNLNNKNYHKYIEKQLKKGLGNNDKKVKKLVTYEVKEILKLNIPYFYTDIAKTHLYDSEGNCYKHFFKKSAIDNLKEKMKHLSEKDKKLQIKKIRESLATS